MSGEQAIQGLVLLFGAIFLALMVVMVISYRRSQHSKSLNSKNIDSKSLTSKSLSETSSAAQDAASLFGTDTSKTEDSASAATPSRSSSSGVPSSSPSVSSPSASSSAALRKDSSASSPADVVTKTSSDSSITPLPPSPSASTPLTKVPSARGEAPVVSGEAPTTSLEKVLSGTKQRMWGRLQSLWSGSALADLDDIEEILYTSDLGPQTVTRLLDSIKQSLSRSEKKDPEVVRSALRQEMLQIFKKTQGEGEPTQLFGKFQFSQPSVWMVVGVNGAGKTTSIGKIAAQLAQNGKKVLLAAGDTFRAAAGSQLKVWTERAQVEIFSPEGITDPSAVAFDAVQRGIAKAYDVIIIDTAGRLHTQHNLMEEIKKMKRVVQKSIPEAPHEILLVLDSNQGQNALMQAKEFHKALGVTGVVLTKLDGTAKGGVAVGVAHELELPIKLIGVGEKMEDLRPFSAQNFVESIL